MNLNLDNLKPEIEKILGQKFCCQMDKEYPECVCMVVWKEDVGPEEMSQVCDIIRKASNQEGRLCANVIDDDHQDYMDNFFHNYGFDEAWKESWNLSIATVRMG